MKYELQFITDFIQENKTKTIFFIIISIALAIGLSILLLKAIMRRNF